VSRDPPKIPGRLLKQVLSISPPGLILQQLGNILAAMPGRLV
jgi:hypothetical protein